MKSVIILWIMGIVFFSCADKKVSSTIMTEKDYRPIYHFSPPQGWMNDPNGMVWDNGEYHLFYQYFPDSNVWGPMHWGHAVSKDLYQWKNLPIALYPDKLGYIFSGSAVVDEDNTAGFQQGTVAPIVSIFTYHDPIGEKAGKSNYQSQGIAYSNDLGRTFTKYKRNPVLKNLLEKKDFRDPKVIWYLDRWIMILAVGDHVEFYQSYNLKEWKYLSAFGKGYGSHKGVWECPDLFQVQAKTGEGKWILLVSIPEGAPNGGSATQYFIGNFDGVQFVPDNHTTHWIDYGTDNYAGVTWNNEPQGEQIFMGWMSNWHYAQEVPTHTWRSAMTIPRKLSLVKEKGKFILASNPVSAIQSYRDLEQQLTIKKSKEILLKSNSIINSGSYEGNFSVSKLEQLSLVIGNKTGNIQFSYENGNFTFDRSHSDYKFKQMNNNKLIFPYTSDNTNINIRFFVDKTSIEIFIDNGKRVMTSLFFPKKTFNNLFLTSPYGIDDFTLYHISAVRKKE